MQNLTHFQPRVSRILELRSVKSGGMRGAGCCYIMGPRQAGISVSALASRSGRSCLETLILQSSSDRPGANSSAGRSSYWLRRSLQRNLHQRDPERLRSMTYCAGA
jgi:hypothetical protein